MFRKIKKRKKGIGQITAERSPNIIKKTANSEKSDDTSKPQTSKVAKLIVENGIPREDVVIIDAVGTSSKRFLVCKTCLFLAKNDLELKRHSCKTNNSGVSEFKCFHCFELFPSSFCLRSHLNKDHGEDVFTVICDTCNEIFSTQYELNSHLKMSKSCRLKCGNCETSFRRTGYFKYHIRVQHDKGAGYECKLCSKRFVAELNLDIQFSAAHSGEEPYKCEKCTSTFSHPYSLKNHMKHTNCSGIVYSCSLCPKTYRIKASVSRHMRKHHEVPPAPAASI